MKNVKMRRCEDEKMFYRPPLLEEPCAQTLSGKIYIIFIHYKYINNICIYLCMYAYVYEYIHIYIYLHIN